MIRALFFAVGLWLVLTGGTLLAVERVTLRVPDGVTEPVVSLAVVAEDGTQTVAPPQWVGFAVTSLGAVVTLYAAALPGRRDEEE